MENINELFNNYFENSSFLVDRPVSMVDDGERYPNSVAIIELSPNDPILDEMPDVPQVSYEEVRSTTARFSSASWFEAVQEKTIIVGGQGGISSWLTLLLSRMRPAAIYTFDMDVVEEVNLAGQLYAMEHVGRLKCDSVIDTVKRYSNYGSIFGINEAYDEDSMASNIMMCGFDNMVARKVFYTNWKNHVHTCVNEEDRKKCLFIDGRLNAETLQVLCITGDADWDMQTYEEKFLFSDSEALSHVCSFKQTAFTANIIAGLMANLFVNFCANLVGGCRTIPFFTSYEADMMYLKQEGGI